MAARHRPWGALAALRRVGAAAGVLLAAGAHAREEGDGRRIVLPNHLPAWCISQAAQDYVLPAEVLVAIVKTESDGRSVVSRNSNGSLDYGVAQINSASWVPYFEREFGISRESLVRSPCQAMRAQAYVLRKEMNSRECGGVDLWCGVGRYHAPNNMTQRQVYVAKVQAALRSLLATGRFAAPGTRRAEGRN